MCVSSVGTEGGNLSMANTSGQQLTQHTSFSSPDGPKQFTPSKTSPGSSTFKKLFASFIVSFKHGGGSMKTRFAIAFYYLAIGLLTAGAVTIIIKIIFWPPCTDTGKNCVIDS